MNEPRQRLLQDMIFKETAAILAESNSVEIAPRWSGTEVLGHLCRLFLTADSLPRKKASRCGVPYGLKSRAAGASYRLLNQVPVTKDLAPRNRTLR
jgi:hypothetical protein